MASTSENVALERMRTEGGTGFIRLEAGGTRYYVNGQEVSKEQFVLESHMGHLLDDASSVKCSKCGRGSVPQNYRTRCGMPQPSGQTCDGVFY